MQGPHMAYSSASDAKSFAFCYCYCFRIVKYTREKKLPNYFQIRVTSSTDGIRKLIIQYLTCCLNVSSSLSLSEANL